MNKSHRSKDLKENLEILGTNELVREKGSIERERSELNKKLMNSKIET